MSVKGISILGSTGSIGTNTLDIAERFSDRFRVVALAAHSNANTLARQISQFNPETVSLFDEEAAKKLSALVPQYEGKILSGEDAAMAVATHPEAEIVVSSMVGAAGLKPTLAALRAGKRVALANKESLVMAGALMMETARSHGAELLPVDSEHSAIHQCLRGSDPEDVEKIFLTASGGPFWSYEKEELASVTVEMALNHPVWKMGPKISVDSSTLMNKGFEAIEARWLFDLSPEQIEILVHPQCQAHSMVAFCDGSVLAQLGASDMRGAISHALAFPRRLPLPFMDYHPTQSNGWEFSLPDSDRFPCVDLAFSAMKAGPGYPALLNAANESAVAAFLDRRIAYSQIARINRKVLELGIDRGIGCRADSIELIWDADEFGRREAASMVEAICEIGSR